MEIIATLRAALGEGAVVTGSDMAPWCEDWSGEYHWTPLCVLRPGSTAEVSQIMQIAHAQGVPVVPVSGNTGLCGGTRADGALMLSLDRMNAVRDVRPQARIAIVEAGVILSELHDAVAAHDLSFPMTFGAKGSARIGGMLSTNAGGSNVLRYGNTRDLVLGIEAVLADGRVVDLMSELHKNNTGYDLRHLLIGAEGTLGVITQAVVKLVPQPRAYATAMVAMPSVGEALGLLNQLQNASGGAVEAFELMPRNHVEGYLALKPEAREPFDQPHQVNLLVELGATAPRDSDVDDTGQVPLVNYLQEVLGDLLERGAVLDAVVAQSESQRRDIWAMREAAAEVSIARKPMVVTDVAVPLDLVERFLDQAGQAVAALDPQAQPIYVAHLGDGNLHYTLWPSRADADLQEALLEAIEEVVRALGGSFSAEHGIGTSKLSSMQRRKDPVALDMMRAIKQALDPKGILNPGKVIP